MYNRDNYTLTRYEIEVMDCDNNGRVAPYRAEFRAGLIRAGFTGWKESPGQLGYWLGEYETCTTFIIYAPEGLTPKLASIAREAMPDQDAVQVVEFPNPVILIEA